MIFMKATDLENEEKVSAQNFSPGEKLSEPDLHIINTMEYKKKYMKSNQLDQKLVFL